MSDFTRVGGNPVFEDEVVDHKIVREPPGQKVLRLHLMSSTIFGRPVQDVIGSALHRVRAAIPGSLAEPAGGAAQ